MKLKELFDVKYGVNLELNSCELVDKNNTNGINFVALTSDNNGVVARIAKIEGIEPQKAGTLSCPDFEYMEKYIKSLPYSDRI